MKWYTCTCIEQDIKIPDSLVSLSFVNGKYKIYKYLTDYYDLILKFDERIAKYQCSTMFDLNDKNNVFISVIFSCKSRVH